MPSQKKIDWVDELEESIREAPDMVFTNFKGLTVEELEELRVGLYENDARYKVVKNRLARRAFDNAFGETVKKDDSGSVEDVEEDVDEQPEANLDDLPGVGPAKVEALQDEGFETVADIAGAEIDAITEVSGIGEKSAEKIQAAANDLAPSADESADTDEESGSDDEAGPANDLDDALDEFLTNNTGVAFSGNGYVNTAKVITKFSEEHENLEIKGGILEGSILDVEQVEEISELPTRHELLTQLASSLNSPIQALATFLNDPIQSLVNSLEQIKDQKEE